MIDQLKTLTHIFKNMGFRYVSFRAGFELKKRIGWLKRKFPTQPDFQKYISFEDWKQLPYTYLFDSKEDITIPKIPSDTLQAMMDNFEAGRLRFFSAAYKSIGTDYDWITHPETGYRYDINKHWLDVNDMSSEAGDIKFVWEKSRFSYLYDLIRYDYHHEVDLGNLVFEEIDAWMEANPINQGPNYKCSQEISLRVMNWTYALHYYKNHEALTEARFEKMMHFIYWQIHHVFHNIHFSRIAVRNNHAITETLMLYLSGILFPFFPNVTKWKVQGKKWLEEEILYQIYEDGTYLQFSHNYQRVLVQLLTKAFYLADLNGESFVPEVYERAYKTLDYLYQCTEEKNGYLPNYGANDGALFFKLSDTVYRDYRPQLNALHVFLTGKSLFEKDKNGEDYHWWTAQWPTTRSKEYNPLTKKSLAAFPVGGFYMFRDTDTFTFVRCGNHKDRPSQADNLHVDIWVDGENILRDAGTYKYNTDSETVRYFFGTAGHNTVSLGEYDQMLKKSRFIWLYWTQSKTAELVENDDAFIFEGSIKAFEHLGKDIVHKRTIYKKKGIRTWEIKDELSDTKRLPLVQRWHTAFGFEDKVIISPYDKDLKLKKETAAFAEKYGEKEASLMMKLETKQNKLETRIEIV